MKQWKLAGTADESTRILQGNLAIPSKVEDAKITSGWTLRETCMGAQEFL